MRGRKRKEQRNLITGQSIGQKGDDLERKQKSAAPGNKKVAKRNWCNSILFLA